MKLHLTTPEGNNLITGYHIGPETSWVEVTGTRHQRSLLVLPAQLITDWEASSVAALTETHFETIAALKPEVVLLGTGATIRFPHPRLWRSLAELGIGMECMDTGAACRTYNILMSEGRHVAAALMLQT